MPDCTQNEFGFPSFDRRKIEASFEGGDVSSDGGMMLLRQVDRRLGLIQAFAPFYQILRIQLLSPTPRKTY